MNRMVTLTRLSALIVLLCAVLTLPAQDYSNIEFIENRGQWDSKVKYKGDLNTGAVFIRSTGFTILQHNQKDLGTIQQLLHDHGSENSTATKGADGSMILRSHAYNVDFVGASPKMVVTGDKPLETFNNYIIGSDPSKWAGNCKIYQAVTLKEIYPNVDVRYYTYNGVMKYDIIARPGADLKKIALKYEGIDKLSIRNKELVVSTSVGELRESTPYTYQYTAKDRRDVSCKYVVKDNILTFDVKGNDPNATLIIDPALIFCSFSGSTGNNWGFTATYGPDGSFYGGGIVFDNGFPTTVGSFQQNYQNNNSSDAPGPIDIGIIKLSPNGSARVYATYVGGSGNEQPHSLVVDVDGNLVLAGRSNSPNYPMLGNASNIGGGYDIVVTKLNATGSGLIGSAKIGGAGDDGVNISINRSGTNSLQQNYGDDGRSEVILDGGGNIYVASSTRSSTMGAVTAGGFQPAFGGGGQDGIILKFDPTLNTRLFGSYIGGTGNDAAYVLAISPTGDVFIAGGTESTDFPGSRAGTIGAGPAGNIDGFVARINNSGTAILQSTYIGTSAIDQIYGVQFDRFGFPYIMGTTTGDMPAINAAYSIPGSKQFIAKLQPDLSAYVYRTTFGTVNQRPNISPTAFLVDRCENVYVSGWGGSVSSGYQNAGTAGLPVTADALPYPRGGPDGADFYFFVLRRNAAGPGPLYASFFGQNGGLTDHVDGGTSRFDRNGVIYQAMCANCGGGGVPPTSPGVWSPSNRALPGCNLGMAKIAFNLAGVGAEVQSAIGGVPRDTAGCLPLSVTFTDIIRNATEYIWDFGDGSPVVGPLPAAAGYTQNHTFNLVGDYRVMMIAIDPASCNERDTSYINIRVGDLIANLDASFTKTGSCNSLEFRFDNLSTTDPTRPFTDSSFTWDFGDGSPRVRAGINPVTHTFPAVGPYQVRLVLNDTTYCNNPDSLLLPINVAANVDAQFTTPPQGCAVYDAVFNSSNTIGGEDFVWDFGDPASGADNTSTLANPVHTYTTPGTYRVRMVANNPNTCNLTDTAYATIVVLEGPVPSFTTTPTAPVLNTPYVFANTSSPNSIRFLWYFGDGDSLATASRSNVTHLYNAPGTYTACLVAYNSLGCSDTVCQDVVSIIEPALDVPNAFAPGRNDINSIVKPMGFGIAKIKFTIYNRQGKKVFETSSRNQGWDGRVNGTIQPMDVYAYTLAVEFFDGTKTTKTGDITLIR
ncbi:MAG: PKD domain-containing protein [Chitinophagaceae bacterium]|nr:MAG: PKD domain-containing protein [Chitinophagaceae bacterium]